MRAKTEIEDKIYSITKDIELITYREGVQWTLDS